MNACQTPKIAGIAASLDATQPIRNEILPPLRRFTLQSAAHPRGENRVNHVNVLYFYFNEKQKEAIFAKATGRWRIAAPLNQGFERDTYIVIYGPFYETKPIFTRF